MDLFNKRIATSLGIRENQVKNTILLLEKGATIPFISRYRKEATGELDEVQVEQIKDHYTALTELQKRKQAILTSIEKQGELTAALRTRIENSWELTVLEDIYLPYKPKRTTRAEIARKKGLAPLSEQLLQQTATPIEKLAGAYLTDEVPDVEEALKGARDILAEQINEQEKARNTIRHVFAQGAILTAKVIKKKEAEADKYRPYFDFSHPLNRCSSHQLLAIRRGEKEGFLRVSIHVEQEEAIQKLQRLYVRGTTSSSKQVALAIEDSYKRLLSPSIETEYAVLSKEKADKEAIHVFVNNLKQLLLAAPLGQKRVLGIDPGYRTGCKIVCLDEQGTLLHNEAIYPHAPHNQSSLAAKKITKLVEAYRIDAIAIGNGTASRETESFITSLRYDHTIQVFVVSESGASIYSASAVAREEFPDYDITVRGAVSIGRRLMDPLAELVKIDPKSIGVGQYQHDVEPKLLKQSLDQTVENCVNQVGVNLNTASKHLLTYISGLGPQLAQNIITYRTEKGAFTSRKELLHVARMGEKTFEQCAGFLRIPSAIHPLDNTSVHPESYPIVEQMARDLDCNIETLLHSKEKQAAISLEKYISDTVGLPTLRDILKELAKPGRDPRQAIQVFSFDRDIRNITDLHEGITLPGIITNITNFGCFVDIGIKENGLVHISQLTDQYVSDPTQVVSIHQQVKVQVVSVDVERKRIQLTMKNINQA